jgi:hypothetical protein
MNQAAKAISTSVLLVVATLTGACATTVDDNVSDQEIVQESTSFRARLTSYYPHDSKMEGGYYDRWTHPLHTLQDFLEGKAPYVSVAMDPAVFSCKKSRGNSCQRLRIPSIEETYGVSIDFRVVDTGSAFRGKGRSRIDVCTRNLTTSKDAVVNATVDIIALPAEVADSQSTTEPAH